MDKLDKVKALVGCRCPRCRIGKVFLGNPYALKKRRVNEICGYCGQYFEIEPGYFYAAMYISYLMMMVEGGLTAWLTYTLTHSDSIWVYLVVILTVMLSLSPINFRYSRLILLYYLSPKIKYDPNYREELLK